MVGYTTLTVYYLRQLEDARHAGTLHRYLAQVACLGYYLAARSEPVWNVWLRALCPTAEDAPPLTRAERGLDPDVLFTPGLSTAAQAYVTDYLAGRQDLLALRAFSVAREGDLEGMEFSISLEPTAGRLSLGIELQYLEDTAIERYWEDLARLTYTNWRPIRAFAGAGGAAGPLPEWQEIATLESRQLHDRFDILGPELVERLGRERVLATPCARVEMLGDGGALLKLCCLQVAARHLGLSAA
jgi:hypothetical protein